MFADPSPALQAKSRAIRPYNIPSYAGRERANARKVGVAEARSARRSAALWQLIETYSVETKRAHGGAAPGYDRRPRGGAFRPVWPDTPEKVRLSPDRRQLRHRDGSVDAETQHLHVIYAILATCRDASDREPQDECCAPVKLIASSAALLVRDVVRVNHYRDTMGFDYGVPRPRPRDLARNDMMLKRRRSQADQPHRSVDVDS